jgi:putative addiction module component (TIGR02574 family)
VRGSLSIPRATMLPMTAEDVLQAALALSPEERLQLIEQLEQSLPDDAEDAFIDMINARIAASDAGAPGHPVEEVLARARLRAR